MPLAVAAGGLTHPVIAVFGVLTAWIPLIFLFAAWQHHESRIQSLPHVLGRLLAAACWLWVPGVPLAFLAI
jgi:hypothetical protein